jgi:hypothetical protein
MSTADRRTVGELLAESDALARETLLDATSIMRKVTRWPARRSSTQLSIMRRQW